MKIVATDEDFLSMFADLILEPVLFVDIETTGLDPYTTRVLLISVATESESYVLKVSNLTHAIVASMLRQLLECGNTVKVLHNAVFDWKHFYHHFGIEMRNIHCTMITEQLIKAGIADYDFGLDDVLRIRFGINISKDVREGFIGLENDVFTQEQLEYSARDVELLRDLYNLQRGDIANLSIQQVYEMEMQLIPITSKMEYVGINIRADKLEEAIPYAESLLIGVRKKLQDLYIESGLAEQIVFDKSGYSVFNEASRDQMLELLRANGIGVSSIAQKELADWDAKHADGTDAVGYNNPILQVHGTRIALDKILGTYYKGLRDRINPITRKIHPSFLQCGAPKTGRFSSRNPNFQNLPNSRAVKRIGLGNYDVREMFVAGEGNVFIISDYAGIELVILAAYSGDSNLISAIHAGDVHSYVANSLYGSVIEDRFGSLITKENRKKQPFDTIRDAFKPVSYGIVYGSTGWNIFRSCSGKLASVGIHMSRDDGDSWVYRWKSELFPETGKFLDSSARDAVTKYYTRSISGRRRNWSPDIRKAEKFTYAAMREGMNAPIQGSSADMTKLSMIYFNERADPDKMWLVATIHDELLVEAKAEYQDEAVITVRNAMEDAGRFFFPDLPLGMIQAEPKVSLCYDK